MSAHLQRHPDALPDTAEDAAEEGTAAAWAAEVIINGDATCMADMVGKVHANGVEIDTDMERHLDPYVAMAQSRISPRAEIFGEVAVTETVKIAGTSDLQSWSSPDDFHIDDLKYGYGIVEPTTLQLTAYALLAYAKGIRAARWHLGIFQPRAVHHQGTYRVITYTLAQIEEQINALWQAAVTAAGNVHTATPGDQCSHCRGGAKCAALTHSVYAMWSPLQSRVYLDPTNQQIADELAMLQQMESLVSARKAAVEAETQQRLNRQQFIPGWAMMPRKGQRKFKYPIDVIRAMTGVDPAQVSICTPAELERRGANPLLVAKLSETPTVGYKLAPYDSRAIGALFGEGKKK